MRRGRVDPAVVRLGSLQKHTRGSEHTEAGSSVPDLLQHGEHLSLKASRLPVTDPPNDLLLILNHRNRSR